MTEEIKDDVKINAEMTAGEILRDARTTGRRKREISTIAKQLCIREEFLTALEDGNYTVLPETVYILGFARNYAMELGVDPDMIVKKIKHELGLGKNDNAVIAQDVHEKSDVQKVIQQKQGCGQKIAAIRDGKVCKFVVKYWKWMVGGIAVLFVIAIIAIMLLGSSGDDHTEAVATIPVVASSETVYRQPVRERFGTENRDGGEIVLQSVSESWVKIEDARGKTVFSRVLVPGDIYYVPAGNKNKATFGNAGGIDVWVRGELVPHVGDDNTRKTGIVLDADTLLGEKTSQE